VTNHFYISRPIFLHRPTFDAWPADLQRAMREAVDRSVAFQRELAIEEDKEARAAILAEGCEITELTAGEHAEFRAAVEPLLDEARVKYAIRLFGLV
jgi:TRAP-type C4-dicarboxylate transport system substrate-binding protein